MRLQLLLRFLLITFAVASTPAAVADVLTTTNGSRLVGTVVNKEKRQLRFKTPFAGTVEINWENVTELEVDNPVRLMLSDDRIVTGQRFIRKDASWEISSDGETATSLRDDEVAYVNPAAWRTNEAWSFDGKVNLAIESERGNSDSDEIDVDGELVARKGIHRFRAVTELERDRSFGETTKSKWLTTAKYDLFTTRKRYWTVVSLFEHDKFSDLNLRSLLGLWRGFQFHDRPDYHLSLEFGPTYTYENYEENDDRNYAGAGWHFEVDRKILGGRLQPYHRNFGVLNLEDTGNVILQSWTGIRYPLRWGIVSSAEIKVEYDSAPVNKTDEIDTTYLFKIGYNW